MVIGRETMDNLLKIGNPKWKTSITKVETNRIITRGYPQEDLIGKISFPEMVYLLINGKLPSENESKMLEAVIVSFCDHGVTPPSTQAARLMASAGSQLNTCVSGGILAFGKHHAGALERSMKMFQEVIQRGVMGYLGPIESPEDLEEVAKVLVHELLNNNEKIPGFGHRYHEKDPRAPKLMELAQKYKCYGLHTQLAQAIQDALFDRKGINMNVDGANAGILSDLGFDWKIATGIFMVGRLPAMISHVYEEMTVESSFRKFFELEEIYYDGMKEINP